MCIKFCHGVLTVASVDNLVRPTMKIVGLSVTVSIRLCVQHDWHDATRRMGMSLRMVGLY